MLMVLFLLFLVSGFVVHSLGLPSRPWKDLRFARLIRFSFR